MLSINYRSASSLDEIYVKAIDSIWRDQGIQEVYKRKEEILQREEFQLINAAA